MIIQDAVPQYAVIVPQGSYEGFDVTYFMEEYKAQDYARGQANNWSDVTVVKVMEVLK